MKNITPVNIKQIKELINKSEKIALLGHHNPDGDAVAGCLAVQSVLSKIKKNSEVVLPSDIPDFLKFLPGSSSMIIHKGKDSQAEEILTNADLIICIDFNAPSRVKKLEKSLTESGARKILLDHHPEPENFTDFGISKIKSSSASEVVMEFIELADWDSFLDKKTAEILYTGIMTDTLNFSINTAGAQTFERVGKLLALGIDKERIFDSVYNTYSWERLQLMGYLISQKTHLIEEHNVAYIVFEKPDKKFYNYKPGDHDGIVNIPLSVEKVKASILFMEMNDKIKISLRSKSGFDVNLLARKYFNGGGHTLAAGGSLTIDTKDIPSYLENALNNFKEE